MSEQVSLTSMMGMVFTLAVVFILPIAACIVVKVKCKAKISSMIVGAGTFILAAMVLEQILHTVVLGLAGEELTKNILLYAIYGGLAAGIFEETGRYLAMKFCMKGTLDKENALMYGVGHGGMEAILLIGPTYISNLMMSYMINQGTNNGVLSQMDTATKEAMLQGLSQLWELPSNTFYLAGVERLCAFVLQIALSYLVYLSVKEGKKGNFLLAIGLHMAVDTGTVLLAAVLPVVAVEVILIVVVAIITLFTYKKYRRE